MTGLPVGAPEGIEIALHALPPDPAPAYTYDWSVTKDGLPYATGGDVDFAFTPNNDGQYVVSLTLTADGRSTGTTLSTVMVSNVAPQFEAGADENLMPPVAGVFVREDIVFTDPGADAWSGTVDFGDGTGEQSLVIDQQGKSFNLGHTDMASGTYAVTVTIQDDDGGTHTETFQLVVILNTPPDAKAGGPYTVSEGGAITLDASGSSDEQQSADKLRSFTDPGIADTHTLLWDFGDGSTAAGTLTPSHAFADNGVYTVVLTVADDDQGIATDSQTVTVHNVAPVAGDNLATTEEESPIAISVLANDSDAAGLADPLPIVDVSNGAHGVARIDDDGTPSSTTDDRIVYTPDLDFNGSDSFAYRISDGDGGFAVATVNVTVNAVNDTPTAQGQIVTVTEDGAVTITLHGHDVETAEGDLAFTIT